MFTCRLIHVLYCVQHSTKRTESTTLNKQKSLNHKGLRINYPILGKVIVAFIFRVLTWSGAAFHAAP